MARCSRNAESLPISHLLCQDTASILHTVPTLSSNPGGSESILENRAMHFSSQRKLETRIGDNARIERGPQGDVEARAV